MARSSRPRFQGCDSAVVKATVSAVVLLASSFLIFLSPSFIICNTYLPFFPFNIVIMVRVGRRSVPLLHFRDVPGSNPGPDAEDPD